MNSDPVADRLAARSITDADLARVTIPFDELVARLARLAWIPADDQHQRAESHADGQTEPGGSGD